MDYAPLGIRINAVCPGVIATPMSTDMIENQPQAMKEVMRDQPIGRPGRPDEVAAAALGCAARPPASYSVWLCPSTAASPPIRGVRVGMKIGIAMFPNVDAPAPGRLGRMIEDRGLESLWFAEHSHLPIEGHRPRGGRRGSVCQDVRPVRRDDRGRGRHHDAQGRDGGVPDTAAGPDPHRKEVATVDVLSHGRVILGVGAGWNRQEMRNHGTDPRIRMRPLTERVQAMIEIWTKDVAEYHGELVDFGPLQAWPKPRPSAVPHRCRVLVVLWRVRYKLSLRDLAEMFLERGLVFTHEAVPAWEAQLAPLVSETLRTHRADASSRGGTWTKRSLQ